MRTSRNKEVLSCKLCTILHIKMHSLDVALHPAWNVNHAFVQRVQAVHTPHLLVTLVIRLQSLYSSHPYCT